MTRRMTITIVNTEVNERWTIDGEHLIQGKWMDGGPLNQILPNRTAKVKSEKRTGDPHGTTGWIRFISNTQPGSTLTITWNKPFGADATTCTVDMNSTKYTAKVENKDFQKSEAWCDVVISVNKSPVTDTKNWMSKLEPNIALNAIIMPGSHDAGMSELHHPSIGSTDANTQTQQLDIKGQLEAGSRYFDIRVDYDHDELITYHRTDILFGWGASGQLLSTVLDQTVEFLKHNSSEIAILKFSHIRHDSEDIKTRVTDMLTSSKYDNFLYKGNDINLAKIKLAHAAGKILAVFDYDQDVAPDKGLYRFQDGFVDDVCGFRGNNLTVCDLYSKTSSYTQMSQDQIVKWNKYAGFGNDYLFLLSWTLTAGASGSIRDLAREANGNLPDVLNNQITILKKGKPNIVYIDFLNVDTARAIIAYNF